MIDVIIKKNKMIIVISCICLLLSGCTNKKQSSEYDALELHNMYQGTLEAKEETETKNSGLIEVSDKEQKSLKKEMLDVADLYKDIYINADKGTAVNIVLDEDVRKQIMDLLASKGYVIADIYSDRGMKNWEQIDNFCNIAKAGDKASATIYYVLPNGGITRDIFEINNNVMNITEIYMDWNSSLKPMVQYINKFEVQSWDYTEKGYLIYKMNVPDNKELDSYSAIRVKPQDAKYSELEDKYIVPIGYQGNNLFTTDWNEQNINSVNFNDLYEYLYSMKNNKYLDCENYLNGIPKSEFETVIESYFSVTNEFLETNAYYDVQTGMYEWYELGCGNFSPAVGGLPVADVVGMTDNSNGTITLIVDAVWASHGLDKAFTHEVTIRLGEGDNFKYVSNYIRPSEENQIPTYVDRHDTSVEYD